jgi:type IV pilus biogenesis protein CpaD/CtpE
MQAAAASPMRRAGMDLPLPARGSSVVAMMLALVSSCHLLQLSHREVSAQGSDTDSHIASKCFTPSSTVANCDCDSMLLASTRPDLRVFRLKRIAQIKLCTVTVIVPGDRRAEVPATATRVFSLSISTII